jgi:hypothetical protein
MISVSWSKNEQGLSLKATVPGNTAARLYLPAVPGGAVKVFEMKKQIYPELPEAERVAGIKFIRRDGDHLVFQLGSGDYEFQTQTEGVR